VSGVQSTELRRLCWIIKLHILTLTSSRRLWCLFSDTVCILAWHHRIWLLSRSVAFSICREFQPLLFLSLDSPLVLLSSLMLYLQQEVISMLRINLGWNGLMFV